MKNLIKFILVACFIGFIISLFQSPDEKMARDFIESPSLKTCPIHHTRYSPNNGVGDCDKCVKERFEKSVENSRRKLNNY